MQDKCYRCTHNALFAANCTQHWAIITVSNNERCHWAFSLYTAEPKVLRASLQQLYSNGCCLLYTHIIQTSFLKAFKLAGYILPITVNIVNYKADLFLYLYAPCKGI
jgi:hypothetical protein